MNSQGKPPNFKQGEKQIQKHIFQNVNEYAIGINILT